MSPILAAVLAMLATGGVVMAVLGALGKLPEISLELPTASDDTDREQESIELLGLRLGLAGLAGALGFIGSGGWPVAGIALAAAGFMAPTLALAKRKRRENLARVEAIATWVESLRDTMAGAAGLQEALRTTARVAPAPIRSEVQDLAFRLRHQSVSQSLRLFARDLAHPLGDMVVASLLLATTRHAGSLSTVMASTAQTARDSAAMWRKIEAGRAGAYSQAKLASAITAIIILFAMLTRREYLEPFDSFVRSGRAGLHRADVLRLGLRHLSDQSGADPTTPATRHRDLGSALELSIGGRMTRAFLIGATMGLGLWLVLRGYFPPRVTLKQQLTNYERVQLREEGETEGVASWHPRIAMRVFQALNSDLDWQIEADVLVTGGRLVDHAKEKLNGALGAALLASVIPAMFGWVSSVFTLVFLAIVFAGVGYFVPDQELKRKAAARREEFVQTLNGFVAMAAVSISGGGGINTALADAGSIGSGWVFEEIGAALEDANIHGESPWTALDRLGRRFNIDQLTELAGALALAGSSGARVTETLRARADAGRAKAISEAELEAEQASAQLSIPLGIMLFGWIIFMAYPAVSNLLAN